MRLLLEIALLRVFCIYLLSWVDFIVRPSSRTLRNRNMRLGSGRGRGGPHLGLRFRNIRHLITSAKHDISSNWDILTRNSHPSTNWIYRNSQKLPHFPSIWSQYDHISLTPVQNLLLFLYYLHLYFWPLTGSCRVWKLCTSAYSLQWHWLENHWYVDHLEDLVGI